MADPPSGFEGFRDSPDAPFYRSGAMSPEKTWEETTARLGRVITSALNDAALRPTEMTPERICRWHRGIFLTTFPAEAGRIREDHEPTSFAIRVWTDGASREVPVAGTSGRARILDQLRVVCQQYNEGRAELSRRAEPPEAQQVASVAAALYAAILDIHPFVDGNLRAAFVALQVALVSVGLAAAPFRAPLNRHDDCLGWAMRRDDQRSTGPLARLLVELMSAQD